MKKWGNQSTNDKFRVCFGLSLFLGTLTVITVSYGILNNSIEETLLFGLLGSGRYIAPPPISAFLLCCGFCYYYRRKMKND